MKHMSDEEYNKVKRKLAKLSALEAGGVDNWEGYDFALEEWHAENEIEEAIDEAVENFNDILVDADVDSPAGPGCGYSICFDEEAVRNTLRRMLARVKGREE